MQRGCDADQAFFVGVSLVSAAVHATDVDRGLLFDFASLRSADCDVSPCGGRVIYNQWPLHSFCYQPFGLSMPEASLPTQRRPTRRPWWGWALAVICASIAVFALSVHWILGLIGLSAGLTVLNISRSNERTERSRLMACLGVTTIAWIVFVALITALQRM